MVDGSSFQQVRDNIGEIDDNRDPILVFNLNENIVMEEGPTKLTIRDINDVFVLGHTVNGVLGVANGSGGGQITLGETDIGLTTISKVVNPNNIFHEHYRYTNFNDTSVSTGLFDTTDFNMQLDSAEVYQTFSIFLNSESPTHVTAAIKQNGGKTTFTATGDTRTITITEGKTEFQ